MSAINCVSKLNHGIKPNKLKHDPTRRDVSYDQQGGGSVIYRLTRQLHKNGDNKVRRRSILASNKGEFKTSGNSTQGTRIPDDSGRV